jgi:2-oxoglutarate ferredoxin oxidoreductase subunit alpha
MRIKAFPFNRSVREFIDAHDAVFVVEQNRDAQLRSLLAIETGVPRDNMTPVLDYGGMPLTANVVVSAIANHFAGVPA